MFAFVRVYDFGEIMNRTMGKQYYKRGEVLQIHVQIDDGHLWIERHAYTWGEVLYRVSPGAIPSYAPQIPRNEAVRAWEQFLGEVRHVECLDA